MTALMPPPLPRNDVRRLRVAESRWLDQARTRISDRRATLVAQANASGALADHGSQR